MAGNGSRSRRGRANSDPFTILQWNCRGFKARTKRAALRLHLESCSHLPAVVALQEPEYSASQLRAIVGLDIKGAFDHVAHEVVLQGFSEIRPGQELYNYVRNSLTDRTRFL
ncbi:hypothetical protein HPB49_026046 [Dermacentor silvarum]|nr:hypothetical protein HPB49_026046 [Dermacentor silvarum]